MAKGRYRATDVQRISLESVLERTGSERVIVAVDIAKTAMKAGLAGEDGEVVELVSFSHPQETLAFLGLVNALVAAGRQVEVALEPTGTYGDALRALLHANGVAVFRVSANRSHHAALVLDGTRTWHDAKSACLIARLHALGYSSEWVQESAQQRDLRVVAQLRDQEDRELAQQRGLMESWLARFWPEVATSVNWDRPTVLTLLATYGTPQAVGEEAAKAQEQLTRGSRGLMKPATVSKLSTSAASSIGQRATSREREGIMQMAARMLATRQRREELDEELAALVAKVPSATNLRGVVGVALAATLIAFGRDPKAFGTAKAFEKACGLNLVERSSGFHKGRLRLSKQGPAAVRRLLHLAALRLIQNDPIARAWYARRRGDVGTRLKAVVALTRKLVRALWHVARGAAFDPAKLFDTRRLNIDDSRKHLGGPRSSVFADAASANP